MQSTHHIRPFAPTEIPAYKAVRLEALRLEPGMFGNPLAKEETLPEEEWKERVLSPDRGTFGLYEGAELIGITSIIRDKNNREEAYMTQSYIRRAHRGKGLSGLLYEARIAWAKSVGIKRLRIGHRESNSPSKAAILHYGFQYAHREPRHWPDGGDEDMVYYLLSL